MWADVRWLVSVTPAPSGAWHQGCILPWGASREAQGPEPRQKDQNRLGRAEERRCLKTGEVGWEQRVSTGHQGFQVTFRSSIRNVGLLLRRRRGQGPHLAKRWEPRGFSRVAAAFSSYDRDLSLPLGLALGSPIFPSGCEGKLGVALESLQGLRDLT